MLAGCKQGYARIKFSGMFSATLPFAASSETSSRTLLTGVTRSS